MKPGLSGALAAFLAFPLGWWTAASFDGDGAPASRAQADTALSSDGNRPTHWREEPVTVDPAKYRVLLNEAITAQLTMHQYGRGESEAPTGYTAFTSRLGLRVDQLPALHRAFRKAAEARLEWEAGHVTVRETGPNEWTLNFPGDGGEGKQLLAENLEKAFGKETAQNIFLKTDIDALFEFTDFEEAFRHGELKVRARTLRSDTYGEEDKIQVAVQSGDEVRSFILGSNTIHPSGMPWRIARLLGGEEALRKAAESE